MTKGTFFTGGYAVVDINKALILKKIIWFWLVQVRDFRNNNYHVFPDFFLHLLNYIVKLRDCLQYTKQVIGSFFFAIQKDLRQKKNQV